MSREKWSRRDLEKLLTSGEAPSPPADLAARIKAEIPDRLPVARAPGGTAGAGSPSRLGPWLLAASVVVALGGGLLAYRTMRQPPVDRAGREPARPLVEEVQAVEQDQRVETAQARKLEQALPDADRQAVPPPAPAEEPTARRLRGDVAQRADRAWDEEAEARSEKREARNEEVVARAGEEAQAELAPQVEEEVPPHLQEAREAAPTAESPAVPPAAEPESLLRLEARPQVLPATAGARKARLADAGLGGDLGAYTLLRQWIFDRGQMPPPDAVRVGELVAELDPALPPPTPGSGEVLALHAEGAPTPFTPGPRFRVVRFAATAGLSGEGAGSRVEVDFDPRGVAGWRLAGDEAPTPPDQSLSQPLEGSRWVALVEIELQPEIPPETPLATLHLRRPSRAAPAAAEPARPLRLGDLAPSWRQASPALRRVGLAAELGEILRRPPAGRAQALEALAAEARELAAEVPGDAGVSELAELAGRAAALARAREAPGGD